jgi:hypothetical protein
MLSSQVRYWQISDSLPQVGEEPGRGDQIIKPYKTEQCRS